MRIAAISCAVLIALACAFASLALGFAYTAWLGFVFAAGSCAIGAAFVWIWIRRGDE